MKPTNKTIIGIDGISPGASTGPGTIGGMRAYLEDLLEFLPASRHEWTFKLFTPDSSLSDWRSLADNVQVVSCSGVPSNRMGRVLYEQVVLPHLIRKERLDLWLGICNVLPLTCPCPSIVIVQSLQYLAFPSAYAPLQRYYLRVLGPASARRADKIIALSSAAQEMIVERLGIPADKVVVAYNGLSQELVARLRSSEKKEAADAIYQLTGDRPYLLSISAFYEYKNLPRLIRAFAQISSEITQQLVIVGAETSKMSTRSLNGLIHELNIQDRVILVGHIPHEQIAIFYRCADALAMPSLEETFGLPIVEAMALGCPVITSNVGSMAEIAGSAAQLVDPWNIGDMAAGIEKVLNDAGYRGELRRRGCQQAGRFINNRSVDVIANALDWASCLQSHHVR
jgi:glycosyltransferase involved in cell wall biosynthesis